MRFAVPVSSGMLSAHFGHSEGFALIDVDEEKREITNREIIQSPGHLCGSLVYLLAERDVSTVIAGSALSPRIETVYSGPRIKRSAITRPPTL